MQVALFAWMEARKDFLGACGVSHFDLDDSFIGEQICQHSTITPY